MTVYFHSRLSCFEDCPQKYKLNYIDRAETEIEESIEVFLGGRVKEKADDVTIDGDATVLLPLMINALFERS